MNKKQEYAKQKIIDYATKSIMDTGNYFDIIIEKEQMSYSSLMFLIKSKVKPKHNKGMLFMCEKSYMVVIGSRGGIKTQGLKDKNLKPNKWGIIGF